MNQQQNKAQDLHRRSLDEFITPPWSLMDLAKHLEVDPWLLNDMINRDELNSSCSSGLSDVTETCFDPTINSEAVQQHKRDLNKVFLPPDKVIDLISALASNPKAFIKPQEKRKV